MSAAKLSSGRFWFDDLTSKASTNDHRRALRSNFMKAALAGVPPLLVYLSTASGYAHWLDSGEFVAVAADFGISHPPGHPMAAIVLGAANLLPFGALSFRLAVICSALLGLANVALFFAAEEATGPSGSDTQRSTLPALRFRMATS